MAKTVFITCFNGFISRNILSTEAFNVLKAGGDIRVVIFAPQSRVQTIREEFGSSQVTVEGIDIASKSIESRKERFFWVLATNLLRTKTRRVQRKVKLAQDNNLADYFFSILVSFFGRFRLARDFFRFSAGFFVSGEEFESFFARYKPDLLFATDVYTPEDVKMMSLAHRRGIKVIGMVRSWDNITSKTLLQYIPDFLVVTSDYIREEAIRYADMPPDKIFVSGVPHYDRYRPEKCLPRGEFMEKYGFGQSDKLILLATPSDLYLKNNPVTSAAIKALADVPAKILVRLPLVGKAEAGDGDEPVNVVFDDPGMYPDFTQAHLTMEADRHLANCLNASDVVITWASTMIIDAAVFNKPIILLGFDSSPRPYAESIIRFYDYEHHQPVLRGNAARLVKSPEELTYWVKKYLENPHMDEEGLKAVAGRYCGYLDGKAGERLGKFLLEKLNPKSKAQNSKQ